VRGEGETEGLGDWETGRLSAFAKAMADEKRRREGE